MSCYDWERGTIKIPAKDYPKVRDAVIAAHNKVQTKRLTRALALHAKLTSLLKGKRGIDKHKFFTDSYYREDKGFPKNCLPSYEEDKEDDNAAWAIEASLFPYNSETRERRKTPTKPKKKDFPLANKATTRFSVGEASVTFDPKAKTVRWAVDENNRAVERAGESWLARALFGALDKVTWTSRTGGKIVGNDEYSQDSDNEGGGGNYVNREYSKEKQEADKKMRRSYSSYDTGYYVGRRY